MENCSTKSERKVLIIGYGNSLRGDDAVGPFVASHLGGFAVHQLTPELAENLAMADHAVFIDARQDLAPGAVDIRPLSGGAVMTHYCTPEYLLQLAREVYGRAPNSVLVGIGADSFELGAPLSPAVLQAAREIETDLSAVLSAYNNEEIATLDVFEELHPQAQAPEDWWTAEFKARLPGFY